MLHLLAAFRPARERTVKCDVCKHPRIRYVWMWGSAVDTVLCDDQSPAHLAVRAAQDWPAAHDFLNDIALTMGALDSYVKRGRL